MTSHIESSDDEVQIIASPPKRKRADDDDEVQFSPPKGLNRRHVLLHMCMDDVERSQRLRWNCGHALVARPRAREGRADDKKVDDRLAPDTRAGPLDVLDVRAARTTAATRRRGPVPGGRHGAARPG